MNYLAVYKGPASTILHKIAHYAICLWTRSKYSHCEIVVDGWCYSSSGRDGDVRKKLIDLTSGKWDLIPLPHLDSLYVLNLYSITRNDDYDYRGLVWFVLPFAKDHKTRWFCSEWCAAAMQLPNASKYHIQNLVDLIKK